MATVFYQDQEYELAPAETVLDCLLRHGQNIPYSCKAGACQSCMMRALMGTPSLPSQEGLKPAYKAQGFVLTCQWTPAEDVEVELPDLNTTTIPVEILEVIPLCHNVRALRLRPKDPFPCLPGQYLTLINSENVARSYSIANQPTQDEYIELHIRLLPQGQMSDWLQHQAKPGEEMHIRGPAGSCFYMKEELQTFPLLLAGTGTGLAPLYGIILTALNENHQGPIQLFHGALKPEDLYYVEQLQALAAKHSNFTYMPCVLQGEENKFYQVGHIETLVMSHLPDLKQARVYVCGAPEFVNSLKKKIFLAGAASKNIYSDAFLSRV